MTAKLLNLNFDQYRELTGLDEDEFLYSAVYELAIRAAKDDIIESLKVFSLSKDNTIDLELEQICTLLGKEKEEVEDYFYNECNSDDGKFFIELLDELHNNIFEKWSIDLLNGYWDYYFIPDKTKALIEKLEEFATKEKTIYGEWSSKSHKGNGFTRVDTTIIEDGIHKDIVYKYVPRYKRPRLNTNIDQWKRVDIEIDVNLPKKILMTQLSKLIDNIQADKINILNKKNAILSTMKMDYEEVCVSPFKHKRELLKMLFSFDYYQLRKPEIEKEKTLIRSKRDKDIEMVKNNWQYDADEKKQHTSEIKEDYRYLIPSDDQINNELSTKLGDNPDTCKKHIIQIKELLKNKNYLKLLNGNK